MDVIISHTSACFFWRRFRGNRNNLKHLDWVELPSQPPRLSVDDLDELLALGIAYADNRPLHILCGSPAGRSQSTRIRSHVHTGPLPVGSILRLSARFAVVSPELCFAQMARTLDLGRLILWGYELCGTYAVDEAGNLASRRPLSEARQLERYLSRTQATPHRSAAGRAARLVLDGAASPMEAKLAMLLTLPPLLGGYGLPAPRLNAPIELSADAYTIYPHSPCRADLFWQSAGVDAEYDGRTSHDADDHRKDRARENALQHDGITLHAVTYDQVSDADAFDAVAKTLARSLGWRLQIRCRNHRTNIIALRRQLGLAA